MHFRHLHHLPVGLPFFSMLVGVFLLLAVLIQLEILRYSYTRLGLSRGGALLLLLGSLVGGYFNLPVAELPAQHLVAAQPLDVFGMDYLMPVQVEAPGVIIAINVGGALIPGLMSLYLLFRYGLWGRGVVATAAVALICHALARPVPGLGVTLSPFVPALAAAIVALMLSREYAAPLAYVGGSLGVLVGADLMNLGALQGLGAPVASIGGAGTFDGIFLTGVVAVLVASLTGARPPKRTSPA